MTDKILRSALSCTNPATVRSLSALVLAGKLTANYEDRAAAALKAERLRNIGGASQEAKLERMERHLDDLSERRAAFEAEINRRINAGVSARNAADRRKARKLATAKRQLIDRILTAHWSNDNGVFEFSGVVFG